MIFSKLVFNKIIHVLSHNYEDFQIILKSSTTAWIMDGQIREKNHQTSKVWAFWACQSATQTKSIDVEKNVATAV